MKAFEVGKEYSMRSACDHECVWTFRVVDRTAKTVTLRGVNTREGGLFRINQKASEFVDRETVFPLGRYSMAPCLRA